MTLKYSNSVLLDQSIDEIGDLMQTVTWINSWMGRAERRVKAKGNASIMSKPYYDDSVPMAYSMQDDKYYPLFPCSTYGNYAYFDPDEKYKIKHQSNSAIYKLSIKGNIVVWLDFRTVYGKDYSQYSYSSVEKTVLDTLINHKFSTLQNLTLENTNFRVQEVFDDYNHREVDHQFAMKPYALFAITVKFLIENKC